MTAISLASESSVFDMGVIGREHMFSTSTVESLSESAVLTSYQNIRHAFFDNNNQSLDEVFAHICSMKLWVESFVNVISVEHVEYEKSYIALDGSESAYNVFKSKLGFHSAKRYRMLLACQDGWDGADGKSIDQKSVARAVEFLRKTDLSPIQHLASVFMDHMGAISIAWKLSADRDDTVEIFFYPDEIVTFNDSDDSEYSFPGVNSTLLDYVKTLI